MECSPATFTIPPKHEAAVASLQSTSGRPVSEHDEGMFLIFLETLDDLFAEKAQPDQEAEQREGAEMDSSESEDGDSLILEDRVDSAVEEEQEAAQPDLDAGSVWESYGRGDFLAWITIEEADELEEEMLEWEFENIKL